MTDTYQHLVADAPARQVPDKNSIATDARGIQQWVVSLPLANVVSGARLLLAGLRETNTLRIEASARLHVLETLRPAVHAMVAQADRQVVGSAFPLPQAKHQMGLQSAEFHAQMALGYRIALHDLCAPAGKIPFLKGGTAAIAASRAIAHHAEQLLRGYLLYLAPHPGVWKAMHDVFLFADAAGVAEKAVADPLLDKAAVSAHLHYAHALLMAISNPYRLTQKEMIDSHEASRSWAAWCSLSKAGAADDFDVAQDEDRGPGYTPDERRAAGARRLAFSPAKAQAQLERDLAAAAAAGGSLGFALKGGPKVSLSPELVRRIVWSWKPMFDRSHSRLPAGHELETLVGLHAIHFHLAGRTEFESFVRELRGPGISLSERDRTASWAQSSAGSSANAEARSVPARARVLDQGLGGYRLQWLGESGARARIGELIGVAAPEEDEATEREWMIGVVRWLRFGHDGNVEAGVELLARQAEPAAIRTAEAGHAFKTPIRAIGLAPMQAGQGGPTFLAPSLGERSVAKVEVSLRAEAYSDRREPRVQVIDPVETLENTGAYLRFAPKTLVREA